MSIESAINAFEELFSEKLRVLTPFRAVVVSVSSGLVTITRENADSSDGMAYARLAGFKLTAGDVVACLNYNGQPIILSKIQNTAPTGYTLDAPLTLDSGHVADFQPMAPVYQDAADNGGSTTNTVTYVEAATTNFGLAGGVGTWDVFAEAWVWIANGGGASVDLRLNINGVAQTAANFLPPSTSKLTGYCVGFQTACSGTIVVKFELKGHSASTTTFSNPLIRAYARRTA